MILIAGVLSIVSAAPAHAATARVVADCDDRYGHCTDYVVYEAAKGERNALSADPVGTALVVRDAGATITPGNNCTAIEGGVACHSVSRDGWGSPPSIIAHLGDEDDTATTTLLFSTFYGGSGNDRLSGGGTQSGGPGDDVLVDAVSFIDDDGVQPGHDTYRGRADEFVSLSYASRTRGVRVDLRPGGRSEDEITGVRSVTGGSGDDVLIGDDGDNSLLGGRGSDVLDGRAGNDFLDADDSPKPRPARDRLIGGPGDDRLWSFGTADLRCGAGDDEVTTVGGFVHRDCEQVARGARLRADLRSAGAPVVTITTCAGCAANRWSVKRAGRTLGTVVVRQRAASLRLNHAGRRALRRQGELTVVIEQGRRITGTQDEMVWWFRTTLRLR